MGPDKWITAGNASQLSDGASAAVYHERRRRAAKRGLLKAAWHLQGPGWWPAASPDEMGIGPVYGPFPSLLKRFGLKMDDIDLWELKRGLRRASALTAATSSAFFPNDKLKTSNGGFRSRSGHPFGHDRGARPLHRPRPLIEGPPPQGQERNSSVPRCASAAANGCGRPWLRGWCSKPRWKSTTAYLPCVV